MQSCAADDWVSARLLRAFLDGRGRLARNTGLVDRVVRVGLVLDLVLRDHLELGRSWLLIDAEPVGFGPADALATWLRTHPDRTLGRAFEAGPVSARDVALALASAEGRSRSVRRAPRLDADSGAHERAELRALAGEHRFGHPKTAVAVALADALALVAVDSRELVYQQCGAASSIIADCCRYLESVMDKLALVATLPNTSG